jgi:tRNA A37 methylthiotransferase MiaB
MGRRYTSSEFIDMIAKIRSYHENITISTDMISGFPGETDGDHEKSLQLIRTVSPDTVNITRFSARPGTEAMSMNDRIHGRISKERSRQLTEIRHDEGETRNRELVGRTVRVLVTEFGKKGTMIARADNYRQVIVPDRHKLGEFVDVEIYDCGSTHLFGRVPRP